MAETANISRMAEKLADDLFVEFFWEKAGPLNENWKCEDQDKHGVSTHPSDVVFYYNEPYSNSRTYVNCDLKSYAVTSITQGTVRKAIESMANQVSCAEKSQEWHSLYAHDHVTFSACGLLFIYNHDGEYDKDFQSLLDLVKAKNLDLPPRAKLIVLGPKDIFWINNVRYEICQMRGKRLLPDRIDCSYYYPQLQTRKNVQLDKARAATLEVLTSPWIILKYNEPGSKEAQGYVIFYRGKGESAQEFIYLIDFLVVSELLKQGVKIHIKSLQPSRTAAAEFRKAVQQYNEEINEEQSEVDNSLADIIRSISYSEMEQVTSVFSNIEIGMDYD